MTLNLKAANQSSHTTLWPMMLPHHTKFGDSRFSSWGNTLQMNIHWNSEPFQWSWSGPQQSNPIFSQDSPVHLMMMYQQTKFSCKRISSSDNILKSHILIILSLTVTLTLKTANQSFRKTIWLMMMHHNTKFGGKKVQQFRKYHLDKHSLIFWNFAVTLTVSTTIHFLQEHSGLW